jgi:membrane associated rhomboid family serine protease
MADFDQSTTTTVQRPRTGTQLRAASGRAFVELRSATAVSVLLVLLIWAVQAINVLDNYGLDSRYGIVSRQLSSLPYILTAPFLHVSVSHIESNTLPLAILAFAAALGGLRPFWYATVVIVLVGGLGTWLTSAEHTVTVGASGLIFGYLGYVVTRGVFNRSVWQIGLGIVMFAYYYWSLGLLFPTTAVRAMHISWQDHLCSFIAGILAAYLAARRWSRPAKLPAEPGVPDLRPHFRRRDSDSMV